MKSRNVVQVSLFVKEKQTHRRGEQMYGHQVEKGAGMNWEIGTDIHMLPCVGRRLVGTFFISESSAQHSGDLDGRGGRRKSKTEGIYVYQELIHFTVPEKRVTLQCNSFNIVKQLNPQKINLKN